VLKLGLVINPYAGLGGSVALKGTDSVPIRNQAVALGATSHVNERVAVALEALLPFQDQLQIYTYPDSMGADLCEFMGLKVTVLGHLSSSDTSADDTCRALELFQQERVDLILFAGGDGTARDVCQTVSSDQVVLGIPCGVKMHSGVFAVNPQSVAEILPKMITGELINVVTAEVRDLDEEAFRRGEIRAQFFGELKIPEAGRFVQQVKSGGREVEALVLDDVAAWIIENMDPETAYVMGSGTTIAFIMDQLGLDNTLLGVDVIKNNQVVCADATESDILAAISSGSAKLIITVIGGQGHLLGRGNQQLSPNVIRRVGRENIIIVSTKTKIQSLGGRPLLVDSGDPELDKQLAGYMHILTGYDDTILYAVEY
jgi:predicted polyphosphate/ATP-dependent NAD kinase